MAASNLRRPQTVSQTTQTPTRSQQHQQQRSSPLSRWLYSKRPHTHYNLGPFFRLSIIRIKNWFFWSLAYSLLVACDSITLLIVYGLCLSMRLHDKMYYRWKTRKFPIWYDPDKNTWYGETALSYPREPTIISSEHTAMALIGIPIAVFLLMQARVRSFWDLNHAIWGHIKAVAVMYDLCGSGEHIHFGVLICHHLGHFSRNRLSGTLRDHDHTS